MLVSTTTHGIKDRDKCGGGLKAFKTYVYIIVTIYSVLSSVTSAEQNPACRCLTLLLVSLRLQNELQRDLGQVRIKSLYVFSTNPRPSDQRVDVIFFTILQVAGGQLLLPLLVMTIFLSKRVKRHPVFINFCISWIASSVTFCLLYVPLHNPTDRVNQLQSAYFVP